jgi:hypothetical protein
MTAAFDADALISMFEGASAKGSAQLQKAVTEATLTALRGRELTLVNIRSSLDAVAKAVTMGAAKNPLGSDAVEGLLDKARRSSRRCRPTRPRCSSSPTAASICARST